MDNYWERIREAWDAEGRASREKARRERTDYTLAERVERGSALRRLFVEKTGAATGGRMRLVLDSNDEIDRDRFQGSSGSPVVLWWEELDDRSSVRAVMQRKVTDRVTVVVDDPPDRLFEGEFNLDLESPETTFQAGSAAIRRFEGATEHSDIGRLRSVLIDGEPSKERPRVTFELFDTDLNDAQIDAVTDALETDDVAMIHGPPGTGKTRTLVEVVRQAVARGEKVLCSAASNAAVDNLAEALRRRGEDPVRIGHPARVTESVESLTLDARIERTQDWNLARKWVDQANELRRKIDARSGRGAMGRAERSALYRQAHTLMGDAHHHIKRMEQAIISNSSIVCATATSAGSWMLRDVEFDLVVIDEATQCPDPLIFIPLSKGRRAVMAGDPQQLPPTVLSAEALGLGLGTTLLERHAGDAVMLEVQHRMNETIMHFPSRTSYDGRLIASPQVAHHRLEEIGVAHDPIRESPLIFIDIAGKGWDDAREGEGGSSFNVGSAERVAAECRRLIGRGLSPDAIAVITPYRAQVARLRPLLPPGIDVDTIDSFQGREAEAVVVDLVRSNADAEIGFLSDTRRMNVALTRARRQLIVIGDSATISHHPYYAAFLDAVESHGSWLSAWTDEAPPFEGFPDG